MGAQLPPGYREMFRRVGADAGSEVVPAPHPHNDLGLGLGIAERAGMVATEQLLFLLARHAGELLGAVTARSDAAAGHRGDGGRGPVVTVAPVRPAASQGGGTHSGVPTTRRGAVPGVAGQAQL
ncbi:hypothetical protein [Streptomyces goshikiensis]|uniref:hypothetical protein n=1 Tax=Streptomyces goshikiensis TaxID=1942 RepID=UPI00367ED4A9